MECLAWSVLVYAGVAGVVKVTVQAECCGSGPAWLRLDGYGETGLFTALGHTRPSRRGTRLVRISASVPARAVFMLARAVPMVRRAACSVAVKEIRSGSSPGPAAARAMRTRMAW
jgi:hypothetical protein